MTLNELVKLMTLWTTGPWIKFPADDSLNYFSQKTDLDISYELSPLEQILSF